MSLRRLFAVGGILFTSILITLNQPAIATAAPQPVSGTIQRISVGSNEVGGGTYASISADGRYVAFESAASDLASGHLNDSWDTYLNDLQSKNNQRVDIRSDGSPVYNIGDYTSAPRVSGDGRYVVFVSRAEDLVSNDKNGMPDVFVHDRQTGRTSLVSVGLDGNSGNADSYNPAITPDGRYVAFESYASNLVPNDTNNSVDIFVRDLVQNTTERVSINTNGQQGSDWHDIGGFSNVTISDDGQLVAFSYASLPGFTTGGVFLRDRVHHTTDLIADGGYPTLSGNGQWIAFVSSAPLDASDTNAEPDVYLFNRSTRIFERVSVSSTGQEAHSQIINAAPGISADGTKIVFESNSPDLVSGDTNNTFDVFLRDRSAGKTTLISHTPDGLPGNGESHAPSISADGNTIAFYSLANDLTTGDNNNQSDVFVYSQTTSNPLMLQPNHIFLPLMSTK